MRLGLFPRRARSGQPSRAPSRIRQATPIASKAAIPKRSRSRGTTSRSATHAPETKEAQIPMNASRSMRIKTTASSAVRHRPSVALMWARSAPAAPRIHGGGAAGQGRQRSARRSTSPRGSHRGLGIGPVPGRSAASTSSFGNVSALEVGEDEEDWEKEFADRHDALRAAGERRDAAAGEILGCLDHARFPRYRGARSTSPARATVR